MSVVKDIKKETASIQFKGFEILIQETVEGVVVDIYDAGENPSTGLLGSSYVFFNDLARRNEKPVVLLQGKRINSLSKNGLRRKLF